MYVIGPGHGSLAMFANTWPEGGYTAANPQFSFPGDVPSHVAPEIPGSIHEDGEPGDDVGERIQRIQHDIQR
jgi:xylulose-5-phosphate/fructose-6-phosphate phosphoketolase